MEVKSKILESISCGVSNLTIWYHKSISAIYNTHTICFWPPTTSNDLNGGQIENSWKYIMWGIKFEDLIQQVVSKLFIILILSVFDLQRPQWRPKWSNKKFLKVYHVRYQTWGFDTTSLSKLFTIDDINMKMVIAYLWKSFGHEYNLARTPMFYWIHVLLHYCWKIHIVTPLRLLEVKHRYLEYSK